MGYDQSPDAVVQRLQAAGSSQKQIKENLLSKAKDADEIGDTTQAQRFRDKAAGL
jgi:hypothetical protein